MQLSVTRIFIPLVPLRMVFCTTPPTADEQAIKTSLSSKGFDAINAMLDNGYGNTKTAEHIDELVSQVVDRLTPFVTEFLSIQGKVEQDETRKNLFNMTNVQSLITHLSSCKEKGLEILRRLSAELPSLCRDQDVKQVLGNATIFAKFHEVISDPKSGIENIDTVASRPIDESIMKRLVLALMQDFHKLVTSDSEIVLHKNGEKTALLNSIASLEQSITILWWVLGGFVVLIIIELVLLFFHKGKFSQ